MITTTKTEPIRNIEDIQRMKDALKNQRDKMLFTLGINTGLRISDLVDLTVDDFSSQCIELREKKTGKLKQFRLSDTVYEQVKEYLKNCKYWLFPSRKGDNHITTTQAWRVIKEASDKCGLEHIGTHSLRKTFGYHTYRAGVPLAMVMEALNHSSEAITLRYIGIIQEELNERIYSQMAL